MKQLKMVLQGEHHGTSAAIEFAVTVLQVCQQGTVRLFPLLSWRLSGCLSLVSEIINYYSFTDISSLTCEEISC